MRGGSMTFAFADPPYLGCCKLYDHYHPDGRCWNELETHLILIDQLCAGYDGWALACSTPSLDFLLPLCPKGTRKAAWVKPFASFKPGVNPGFTWEAVLFYGARKRERFEATVKDHIIEMDPALIESITLQKGLTGAKPRRYAFWIFDLLGLTPDDEFEDVFPGTGIVSRCWEEFCSREHPVQEGMLA